MPNRPSIGVALDRERVARYAELYETSGDDFAFHTLAALTATPLLPKA